MQKVFDDIGVIAILGAPYCGSTVMNYVLNTDPRIFGGSELRRLVYKNDTVQCSMCGSNCSYWTKENISLFAKGFLSGGTHKFYRKIANIVSAPYIADSSKLVSFFGEKFLKRQEDDRVGFMFVVPVKHPIRFFSSYIFNAQYSTLSHTGIDFNTLD